MKMKYSFILASIICAALFAFSANATKLTPVSATVAADSKASTPELSKPTADLTSPTHDIIKPATEISKPAHEFQRPIRELVPMPISERTSNDGPSKPVRTSGPTDGVYLKQK